MKNFLKILFACFCALILFFLVFFISMMGMVAGSAGGSKTKVAKNSILFLDLNQAFGEQTIHNSLAVMSNEPSTVVGLNDLLQSIKAAKTDDKIKGIYIKMGVCPNGWATMQEIKNALNDFKTSTKFIVAYGDIADQKSYYAASPANSLYLNPVGGMEFNGMQLTGTFFKGTLDKLDIKTEAFHCGKFKGAHEPFSLNKFSDANRFQLHTLLNDFNSEFLQTISKRTGIDTTKLSAMAENGDIKFAKDAYAQKLIDATLYVDSVENILRSKLSLKPKDKINLITTEDYCSSLKKDKNSKNKIAVLYASGAIMDGEGTDGIYSKNFLKEIKNIIKDDDIKAVVLRINSPGGSALASEIIYHELMNLKKIKPITVSMGNYAASGGYYIACAADSIFADENTLTGSIGVVGVLANYGDMMKNKLGITTDVIKTNKYADFPSATRTMTPLEKNWIQSYLDTTYNLFKSRVATARKMTMAQVEELAQGHVYSGKLAHQLKLVDGFGNHEKALSSAATMAKLKDYEIIEFPEPKDKLDEFLESFSGEKKEEEIISKRLGNEYIIYKEIKNLKTNINKIQTVLPWHIEIK